MLFVAVSLESNAEDNTKLGNHTLLQQGEIASIQVLDMNAGLQMNVKEIGD